MSLLDVSDLTVRYGDTDVVRRLSFSIAASQSVGMVGESGSGKTQTALSLLGLLPESAQVSGSVRLDGEEIVGASDQSLNRIRARRIGIVFQDPMQALNPYLSIGKQLRQVLLQHDAAAATKKRVVDMLDRVGLPDPLRQYGAYPHELSGGMRQRVMIASALIAEPALLIADEPTTALDVTVQAQILDLLESLRHETALLLITHDLAVVAGRCERLLVLKSGELVETGATRALFDRPVHEHTRALLRAAPRIDTETGPETTTGDETLVVEDANVAYRSAGNSNLNAVVDVSLTLRHAETLAVVGESGSGKSSLVRAVLGLVPLHAGRVVFLGESLAESVEARSLRQRRDLQLVFQDPASALNPQMRVGDIVGEPLRVHDPTQSSDERRQTVVRALEQVGLDERMMARFPHQLSGGQAQRVAIARALVLEPGVLVFDEAVSALDGEIRQQVLALIKDVQTATGMSVLFISHDLAVVRSVSHRIAVMYLGRLVEVVDNAALFDSPRHPYTRALIDAVPVPDPHHPRITVPLRGEVPSPRNPPDGCVFHPRCHHAIAECRAERPVNRNVGASRVACHRADEIDLSNPP